jgi:putative SOS response-associated peptidase YedK
MCGRFELHATPAKIKKYFDLTGELHFSPSWNIAPTTPINSIVAYESDNRHLKQMYWGLIPSWAKDRTIATKLINARSETVAEKPSFRNAFKRRRCIIPASGFYEWKAEEGKKQPWYISHKSDELMAFAGLWEHWTSKEGDEIESCCIITTHANPFMEKIHSRMPVILNPEQWSVWLSQKEQSPDKLLPVINLKEYKSMQAWLVTRELNRAGFRNDEGLVEPLPDTK